MLVAIDPRLSGAIHIRRVSDGDVRVPTLGRSQRVARRHRNAASNSSAIRRPRAC